MNLRRSTRRMSSLSLLFSDSEYHASEKSVNMDEQPYGEEPKKEEEPPEEVITTRRGRYVNKMKYLESSDNDGEGEDDPDVEKAAQEVANDTSHRMVTRASAKRRIWGDNDEDDNRPRRLNMSARLNGFIASDDEDARDDLRGYSLRNRMRWRTSTTSLLNDEKIRLRQQVEREQRMSRRIAARIAKDEDYEHASSDPDGPLGDAQQSSNHDALGLSKKPKRKLEAGNDGYSKPNVLRQRRNISYAISAPLEESVKAPIQGGNGVDLNGAGSSSIKPRLGSSTSDKGLGRLMGANDSDSNNYTRLSRNPFGGLAMFFGSAVAGGGTLNSDVAARSSSKLSNRGKARGTAPQDLISDPSNRKVARGYVKGQISKEDNGDDNRSQRLSRTARLNGFIASDDEDTRGDFQGHSLRNRTKRPMNELTGGKEVPVHRGRNSDEEASHTEGPPRKKTNTGTSNDAALVPESRPPLDSQRVSQSRHGRSIGMNTISTNLDNSTPGRSQILAGASKPHLVTSRFMRPQRRTILEVSSWFDLPKIWMFDRDFITFQEMNPLEPTDRIRAAWIQARRNPTDAARYLADPTWLPVDLDLPLQRAFYAAKCSVEHDYRSRLNTKTPAAPPAIKTIINQGSAPIDGPLSVDTSWKLRSPGLEAVQAAVHHRTNSLKQASSSSRSPEEDTEQQHADADGDQQTRRLRKRVRLSGSNEDSGNEKEEGNKEEKENSDDEDKEKEAHNDNKQDESDDDAFDPNVLMVEPSARHSTRTTLAQSQIEDEDGDYDDRPSPRNGSPAEDVEDDDALSYASEPEPEPELGAQVANTAPMSRKEQIRYLMDLKRQREEQERRD